MKNIWTLIICFFLVGSVSAQFGKLDKIVKRAEKKLLGGEKLTEAEIGNGLKEALNIGVGKAVDFLSAENGYFKSPYKILLPEQAQNVLSKVSKVPGFEDAEAKMEKLLNRAAEDAANKAKPIFVSAIKQMTFKDAMNILMGEKRRSYSLPGKNYTFPIV